MRVQASAMAALATLRATRVDGMRVAVSYREVPEPSLRAPSLPHRTLSPSVAPPRANRCPSPP